MSGRLPALMDCKMIQEELGVKRATAEAIMRAVPSVEIPGVRKNHVRRDDVLAFLDRQTKRKGRQAA